MKRYTYLLPLIIISLVLTISNCSKQEPEDVVPQMRLHWTYIAQNLDPNLLIKSPNKSFDSYMVYPNPRTAAIESFKYLLTYKNYSFTLIKPEWRTKANKPFKTVTLYLLNRQDEVLNKINAQIPIPDSIPVDSVYAWAVDLPLLGFHQLRFLQDTMAVYWREKMGRQGVITFTYPIEKGYKAVEGFAIDFREK